MQIIPILIGIGLQAVGSFVGSAIKDFVGSNFSDALEKEVTTQNKTKDESAQKASQSRISGDQAGTTFSSASPVEQVHSTREDLRAADKIKVTQEDFAALEDSMRAVGFSNEEMESLRAEVASANGLTWDKLNNIAQEKTRNLQNGELSTEDRQNIVSFLNKLGFNQRERDELLGALEGGDVNRFMSAVQRRLAQMPSDSELSFNAQELASLAKMLGLSTSSAETLSILSDKNLGPSDFLMALRGLNLDGKSQALTQEGQELESKIAELMRKAAEQTDKTLLTEGKDLRNQQIAQDIQNKIQNSRNENRAVQAQGASSNAHSKDNAGTNSAAGDNLNDATQAAVNGKANSAKNNNQANQQNGKGSSFANGDGQNSSNTNSGTQTASSAEDKAFAEFWSKLRTSGNVVDSKAATVGLASQTGAVMGKTAAVSGMERFASSNLLRQVETALLQNLSQGVKRLSIQLAPENLGKMNVIMQVQNKEVKAIIKAESQDTARMLNENLAQIRASLENQGLKVAKVEIQTNMSNDSGQSAWQGMQNHNEASDRHMAFGKTLEQLRNLSGNADNLDREMQNEVAEVNISRAAQVGPGELYIVA